MLKPLYSFCSLDILFKSLNIVALLKSLSHTPSSWFSVEFRQAMASLSNSKSFWFTFHIIATSTNLNAGVKIRYPNCGLYKTYHTVEIIDTAVLCMVMFQAEFIFLHSVLQKEVDRLILALCSKKQLSEDFLVDQYSFILVSGTLYLRINDFEKHC